MLNVMEFEMTQFRQHALAATLVVAGLAMIWTPAASAQQACRQGYVWREALSGDRVCVPPATRAQAARDNSLADARRDPGGGASGPATCRQGYVWREAMPGDTVCVSPDVRAQTASDNAAAASRRVAAGTTAPVPAPQAAGYRTSGWSGWSRRDGIEYRYSWGWDPRDRRYERDIDAIFELRNTRSGVWHGAARTLNCTQDTLQGSRPVTLQPLGTTMVRYRTPNCGTLERPTFRPDIVTSRRID